jgi:hypothetical protein
MSDSSPGRQIELRDQQDQGDSEGHGAEPREDGRTPGRDGEQHPGDAKQGQTGSECHCRRGAEPDGID